METGLRSSGEDVSNTSCPGNISLTFTSSQKTNPYITLLVSHARDIFNLSPTQLHFSPSSSHFTPAPAPALNLLCSVPCLLPDAMALPPPLLCQSRPHRPAPPVPSPSPSILSHSPPSTTILQSSSTILISYVPTLPDLTPRTSVLM